MAEESEVQPVNKTYNTIEPQVNYMLVLGDKSYSGCSLRAIFIYDNAG